MIEAISNVINSILSYFYSLVNNYGIAIIMLTVLVNIITYPLTRKQLQSSKKMQDIQPELNRLKEKYKNNKEKLNQATMDYMKDNKVNPLGGCLPLIVQFPIMIAVFQLLRNQVLISETIPNFNPYFITWNLTEADPYYVLPVLAAGATFLQQRWMITDPSQKMMMYIFPVMILVISRSMPAGLVLYWFTNSLFSIGHNIIIKKEGGLLPAEEKSDQIKEKLKSTEDSEVWGDEENKRSYKPDKTDKAEINASTKEKRKRISTKGPKKKSTKVKKKGAGNSK
jgi:YidC/Oxa1 family membrane protein insertase